ncbi:MAG: hypothetical protein HOB51_07015, partial [Thaumarchaeota archaeon]|nr:hypothetical protein [Nitrososphaerota archaeon]
ELGEVSIEFLKNTGYVQISKGGFNDKRIETKNCDVNSIPSWIKLNAQWWIEDKIDENSFLEGMRYLIKENIIVIPENMDGDKNSVIYETGNKIPVWVKTTVEWWAGDITNDETFLQGMQFLVTNKIIDLSEDRRIEQPIVNISIQDALPSRNMFVEAVFGISPEFGTNPGGFSYNVSSGDDVDCGSEGVRARYFTINDSENVKYQTHVCLFSNAELVKKQLTEDMKKTSQGSGAWSSSSDIVTIDTKETGYCYYAESKRILGIYCGIDEYFLSSTVEGDTLDKENVISIQQKTIENFQKLRQSNVDVSLLELIESGTTFVDSSSTYSSEIISQSSKDQSFENSECTGEFPFRWSDGNCWNLPEDYETQIELTCPDGFPYVWNDGNCYKVPECNSSYPYRGSDGQCYNMPECTTEFPYRWDDNQCYNLPQDYEEQLECKGEFPFRWSDGGCYNMQECPSDYQYRWNDGQCYNVMECTGEFPYRWDNGICYNVPPPLACVNNHNYDTGYGYCCPNDMYTTGNGMCEFIQACPAGYWETNYGDCCPDGTFDPGDGSCRYP